MQQVIDQLTAVGLEPIVLDGEEKLPRKRETNTEFITRIMDFCPHGPIVQAFVLEGVMNYCERVSEASDEDCESPVMAPGLWKAVGKWMQGELDARFAKG